MPPLQRVHCGAMKRLMKFQRKLARRLKLGVEIVGVVAFVVEAFVERFGDPGFGFVS